MATGAEVLRDALSRIDILESRVDELEKALADSGDGWLDAEFELPPKAEKVPAKMRGPQVPPGLAITPEDTPEQAAAKARLLRDAEREPEPEPPENELREMLNLGGTAINVVPPNEQQAQLRQEMIDREILKELVGMPTGDMEEAYRKGGPLWLHNFDRDFVMSLPPLFRQLMVNDLAVTMPVAAAELSRDILKRSDSDSDAEYAMAQAEWTHNNPVSLGEPL